MKTVVALDEAIRQASGLLLRTQRKDGSWEGKAAPTALALQALASVEPPPPEHAPAVERAAAYLMRSVEKDDAAAYAAAYVLAAVRVRPRVDDFSGLLGMRKILEAPLGRALRRSCTPFQRAVILGALHRLRAADKRTAPLRPTADCATRLPDPTNADARLILTEAYEAPQATARLKPHFDSIISHEEHAQPYESGPLGQADVLWTSVGFLEMRYRIVEPQRGCLFSSELLGKRLLALRAADGSWPGNPSQAPTASALLALVNLRSVFDEELAPGAKPGP